MKTEIVNANAKLIYHSNLLVFLNIFTGKTVMFTGGNEFLLYLENDKGEIHILTDADFCCLGIQQQSESSFTIGYECKGIYVRVHYRAREDVFVKQLEIEFAESTLVKRICLENRTVNVALMRGGEGQPIFAEGDGVAMWCGIEFPVANNGYEGNTLCCMQSPFERVTKFSSLPVVYGMDTCGDLFAGFSEYIKKHAVKKQPLKIYCDWGSHDDLTPGEPILTAELTLKNISDISELYKKSGVKFDYYLMDDAWFELNCPYTEFRKETFPQGYAPIVDALKKADLKYGLWFDINYVHEHLDGMEEYDTMLKNGSLCFSCDKIAQLMTDGIAKQIRDCGLKMLKLDFAYFECNNPAHEHSIELTESKEKAVKNFLRMIKTLKEIEPELKILCYNGWTTSLQWIGSVEKREGYAISPYWSAYVDYLYCGDPRPSEIANEDLSKSLVWYTDAMVREFTDSAIPLESIDDHGTMLGVTSTIYKLGTKLFRQGVLMNIMRGGKKEFLYGDVSCLNEKDCQYLHEIDKMYNRMMQYDYRTELIAGDARKGEVYGYTSDCATEGYVVLVNPMPKKVKYTLTLPKWKKAKVAVKTKISDGELADEAAEEIGDSCLVDISAGGYVLIEWSLLLQEKDFDKVVVLPNEKLVIPVVGKKYLQITFTKNGRPFRTGRGCPVGFKVVCDGKEMEKSVKTDIWSGISWAHYTLANQKSVTLINDGEDIVTLKYYMSEM